VPSLSPKRRREAASIAALTRWRPDDAALAEQRRDYHAAGIEEHIRRLVDQAPPLSTEQRNRLALLPLGGGGDASQ
jgi:hypothetical protein